MWGDATLVCSPTVAGGIHSVYLSSGERDMKWKLISITVFFGNVSSVPRLSEVPSCLTEMKEIYLML